MRAIAVLAVLAATMPGVSYASGSAPGQTPAPDPAPNVFLLDLADGDKTTAVDARKEFRYQVIDKLPATVARYSITSTVVDVPLPELVLPGAAAVAAAGQGGQERLAEAEEAPPTVEDCKKLIADLTSSLQGTTSEAEVQSVIAQDRTDATCNPKATIDLLTTDPVQSQTLKSGQTLTVTVTRPALGDEKSAPTWTFKFVASPKGTFLMHYGFSFLGNRDQAFTAVAEPGTSPTEYKLKPKAKRNNIQYLASFTFTYVPARFQHRGWAIGPTAGLGTDLSNVTAFGGVGVIVGDNLNFYVGLAGTKQQRLNGKYHLNDTVKDNLTDDQVNEKVYVPTIVFGVGFRFSSNPFSNNGSGSQPATAQPAKPAAGSGS